MTFEFDHIAVGASSLDAGIRFVKDALGVDVPGGGTHQQMGTHNHLMRLGTDEFLEIIAIDPGTPAPKSPRWYGLDTHADAAPRVGTWVVRSNDLDRALATLPPSLGVATRVTRGDLSWRISVPDDGSMPFDGAFPTLIEWPSRPFPGAGMADLGCSLENLVVRHPNASIIEKRLSDYFSDSRVTFEAAPNLEIVATIATPGGLRTLR